MAAMSAMALSASAFTTCDRVKPKGVIYIYNSHTHIYIYVYASQYTVVMLCLMKDRNNSTSLAPKAPKHLLNFIVTGASKLNGEEAVVPVFTTRTWARPCSSLTAGNPIRVVCRHAAATSLAPRKKWKRGRPVYPVLS